MTSLQNLKFYNLTPPAAKVNNASATVASLDCIGADYATIIISYGTTDIAATVCKLQESDDNSTWVDITGGALTPLPTSSDGTKQFVFYVDLKARKRYLNLVLTVGNGTTGSFLDVIGILGKLEQGVTDATGRNVKANLLIL